MAPRGVARTLPARTFIIASGESGPMQILQDGKAAHASSGVPKGLPNSSPARRGMRNPWEAGCAKDLTLAGSPIISAPSPIAMKPWRTREGHREPASMIPSAGLRAGDWPGRARKNAVEPDKPR